MMAMNMRNRKQTYKGWAVLAAAPAVVVLGAVAAAAAGAITVALALGLVVATMIVGAAHFVRVRNRVLVPFTRIIGH
jgi:hypothetical protein